MADRSVYQAKWRADHLEERRAYDAKWRIEHPDKRRAAWTRYDATHRDARRLRDLLRKYDITKADFDRMLAQQGGKCLFDGFGTCHEQLCVHHTDDGVVGILCRTHNMHLGHFGDTSETLRLVADRLDTSQGLVSAILSQDRPK